MKWPNLPDRPEMEAFARETETGPEIVTPVKNKSLFPLPETAVLVASQTDLADLCRLTPFETKTPRPLYNSRLYGASDTKGGAKGYGFVVCGPMVGAPYTVMVLETLAAWGVKRFIFFGWCGAIQEKVATGDIILPADAYIDEGTSRHYACASGDLAAPDPELLEDLTLALTEHDLHFHRGTIWTTDAIFRETHHKVRYFQQKGALGVEMELSAIFSVARYRRVKAAGILVVSDELSDFTWRPGFKNPRFKTQRRRLCEVINSLCHPN